MPGFFNLGRGLRVPRRLARAQDTTSYLSLHHSERAHHAEILVLEDVAVEHPIPRL